MLPPEDPEKTATEQLDEIDELLDPQYPHPVGDTALIQMIPRSDEPQKVGSLYVPDSVDKREREPDKFVVIDVGEGRATLTGEFVPVQVAVGDVIVVSHPGTIVNYDGAVYYVVPMSQVVAVLPE
jgi:co-chaperonin GroES (HSP10)